MRDILSFVHRYSLYIMKLISNKAVNKSLLW